MTATIKCDKCGEGYEYEEESWIGQDGIKNISVDTMPDGFFIEGKWICDDCARGEICCVCGKSNEDSYGLKLDICDCVCPNCGHSCFDDVDIADHGECRDCHHARLMGEITA